MSTRRIGKRTPGVLLLALCLFVLAACGSNTTTSASPSSTSTVCTQGTQPATALRATTGILQSISGQTLVVTNTQGKNITVTYTSSTTFSQEVKLTAADLKEGTPVRVAVTNAGGTYTAVIVTVSEDTTTGRFGIPGSSGTPGAKGGNTNNPCLTRDRNGSSNANFRGLVGTVRQVNGDLLIIADTAGTSYTVTLTAQTQIVGAKSTTAAALKAGKPLAITGKPDSNGGVTASTITLLLNLPKPVGTPSATPSA